MSANRFFAVLAMSLLSGCAHERHVQEWFNPSVQEKWCGFYNYMFVWPSEYGGWYALTLIKTGKDRHIEGRVASYGAPLIRTGLGEKSPHVTQNKERIPSPSSDSVSFLLLTQEGTQETLTFPLTSRELKNVHTAEGLYSTFSMTPEDLKKMSSATQVTSTLRVRGQAEITEKLQEDIIEATKKFAKKCYGQNN